MTEPSPERAESCLPDSSDGATQCRYCGEALPRPTPASPAASGHGVPFALVTCPGCGAEQVRALDGHLCTGESLALRQALAYLARRPGPPVLPPSSLEDGALDGD